MPNGVYAGNKYANRDDVYCANIDWDKTFTSDLPETAFTTLQYE